mmetsp:Transcript_121391/g.329647  ORF Transcript_121391/g.329647 Transcript_121391/m.329647 type:complete len:267 (-) Transcript_121391:340-1140(-)
MRLAPDVQPLAPGLGVPVLRPLRPGRRATVGPVGRVPHPGAQAADAARAAAEPTRGRSVRRPAGRRGCAARLAGEGGPAGGGRARWQGGRDSHSAGRADGRQQLVGKEAEEGSPPRLVARHPGDQPRACPQARPRHGAARGADPATAHQVDGGRLRGGDLPEAVHSEERAGKLQLGEAPDAVGLPPQPAALLPCADAGRGRGAGAAAAGHVEVHRGAAGRRGQGPVPHGRGLAGRERPRAHQRGSDDGQEHPLHKAAIPGHFSRSR